MNFKFKLSRRMAVLLGVLAFGCKLTDAGPVIPRVVDVDLTPDRFSLMPQQSADVAVIVLMSRTDSSTDGSSALLWSTTGGAITNNYFVDGVRHLTYTAPSDPGDYKLIITTVTGTPADTASFAVAVAPVPVSNVAVTPGSLNIGVADTATLRVTLTDATGAIVVGRPIEWSSSDGAVAQVLVTGFVRALAAGTTTITASTEGHTGSAVITVTQ